MSRHPFYEQAEDLQIAALQRLAQKALAHYDMADAQLEPVAYRENMTFSVDAGARGRFAMRVHQAGYRTDSQVQSELDFLEHVNAAGVRTPKLIRTAEGRSFVHVGHGDVDVERQCNIFEWIDGKAFRKVGEPVEMPIEQACTVYEEVGRQVARIYNATENWTRPKGFDRPNWDEEGIYGVNGQLGDFRKIQNIPDEQRKLLDDVAARVSRDLAAFGKTPDRYGLTQGDLLPENIMVCDDGIRLIDFDDTGESWVLFEFATALIDLAGSEFFDPCLGALTRGFRELRPLPDEHLAMLPAFMMARLLSYVAHTVSRSHLEQAAAGQQMMLALLEEQAPAYLAS